MEGISFDREFDVQAAYASYSSQSYPSNFGAETPSRASRTQSASNGVLNHDRAHVKSMMSDGNRGKLDFEIKGDKEKGTLEGKVTASWEWGGKESRSERSRDRSETERSSGEINSTDRD